MYLNSQVLLQRDSDLTSAVSGSGDEGTGSRRKLRDQAGAGSGQAAVQHDQREPGESTGHHQGAAAAAGKHTAPLCATLL